MLLAHSNPAGLRGGRHPTLQDSGWDETRATMERNHFAAYGTLKTARVARGAAPLSVY